MAHSTGTEERLGREIKNVFGDPKYAKEELVAELTAAVSCQSLGIVSGIQDDNAKYLKNWLGAIRKEPKFLLSVLSDVGKASNMILSEVCKEQDKKKDLEKENIDSRHNEMDENKKTSNIQQEEGLSPTFKAALAAAIGGSFQQFIDLKENGYKISQKELDILKNTEPKVNIAVQKIFNITSEIQTISSKLEVDSKPENKQLTLNL